MNYSATMQRFLKTDKYIISNLILQDSAKKILFSCYVLELPNLNNQKQISCIPKGIYSVQRITSPKHGLCYEVLNVPNRSNIEIHIGNYPADIMGCLAVGLDYIIPKDYKKGQLLYSKQAFENLMKLNIIQFDLNIIEIC